MTNHSRRSVCWAAVVVTAVTLISGCKSNQKTGQQVATGSPIIDVEQSNDPGRLTQEQRASQFQYSYDTGMEMVSRQQYAHAMGAFEEALRLNPSSRETMFNLAACYDSIGDSMRAIQMYRQLLEANPNDADCHANLGTAFIKLYYRERSPAWRKMAWDSWERSLRLNPEQPEIQRYLKQSKEAE